MIRPLRRVHRATFVVLPVVLLGLSALAVRARVEPARMPALPAALRTPGVVQAERLAQRTEVLERLPLDWNEPDALIYWADSASLGGPLPSAAVLVGSAQAGVALPRASDGRGTLVYSLPHGRVVWWRAGGSR